MGVRGSRREAMNEVYDPVAPVPARLVPHPIGHRTGSDSQTDCGDEAQLSVGCEGPGCKQKSRRRHRQTYLTREYRSEQDGIPMSDDEMDESIHNEACRLLTSFTQQADSLPFVSRSKPLI